MDPNAMAALAVILLTEGAKLYAALKPEELTDEIKAQIRAAHAAAQAETERLVQVPQPPAT